MPIVISIGLRAAKHAACWIAAVSVALSLSSSPAAARPQDEAPSAVSELPERASAQEATIDTVEVRARREALRHAIHTFVSNVTLANGEILARWRYPICASVAGATREQSEFIRSRVLEIAASAGAALDEDRGCRANLLIVLTAQPDQLLAAWTARNPRMFANASAEKIDGSHAARPVRLWRNVSLMNADGTSPIKYSARAPQYRLKDSHLKSSVAQDISSVIVLVDTTATRTATFDQLADYLALVSLAQIDMDADFAGFSTILRLFAEPGAEAIPSRLTQWDQAFLRGLYKPSDPPLRQRSLIVTSMAQELVP